MKGDKEERDEREEEKEGGTKEESHKSEEGERGRGRGRGEGERTVREDLRGREAGRNMNLCIAIDMTHGKRGEQTAKG